MEEDFYDEEYSHFDNIMSNLKEQLKKEVKREIKDRIKMLEKQNIKINEKNEKLLKENKQLKKQKNEEITLEMLRENINKSNIKEIVSVLLPKSNNSTLGMRERYDWFELLINYYDNKELILKLFDFVNIELPNNFIKNFKIPYEWNEEELDLWFNDLFNNYVCNGCIFEANLGFWYEHYKSKNFETKKCINSQYNEIPWQLVMKNPLIQTEKYINKICEKLEKNEANSYYFLESEELKKEHIIKRIVNVLDINKEAHRKYIIANIEYIENERLLDDTYKYIIQKKPWGMEELINKLPKKYILNYLNKENKSIDLDRKSVV